MTHRATLRDAQDLWDAERYEEAVSLLRAVRPGLRPRSRATDALIVATLAVYVSDLGDPKRRARTAARDPLGWRAPDRRSPHRIGCASFVSRGGRRSRRRLGGSGHHLREGSEEPRSGLGRWRFGALRARGVRRVTCALGRPLQAPSRWPDVAGVARNEGEPDSSEQSRRSRHDSSTSSITVCSHALLS